MLLFRERNEQTGELRLGDGEFDFYFEAFGRAIAALDGATASFDTGSHNRQTQPDTTRLPLTRQFRPVKRFEHRLQFGFGNAGAVVSYRD